MAESVRKLILRLLQERGAGKTICPSEAARALAASNRREDWEPKMASVRRAATSMVAAGELEVTQRGQVVELEGVKGPIRLRAKV